MRRFIRDGVLPPPGAVRIEELINYFDYDYPQPEGTDPDEWLTIKLRYKEPDGEISKLLSRPVAKSFVPVENASINLRFAAAVAEYGMLLRNSAFKENSDWQQVAGLARNATGTDPEGYRHEFVNLVETARSLSVTRR